MQNKKEKCAGNGWWWLRSPGYDLGSCARDVRNGGNAGNYFFVNRTDFGAVPALQMQLQ